MKQEVEISVHSIQVMDEQRDEVQFLTNGNFYQKNGQYYLSYQETEDTGFSGCRSVLKWKDDRLVTITRFGSAASQLLIECGQSRSCPYNTGYGILDLEVMGHEIVWAAEGAQGHLFMKYTLNMGADTAIHHKIHIQWREALV